MENVISYFSDFIPEKLLVFYKNAKAQVYIEEGKIKNGQLSMLSPASVPSIKRLMRSIDSSTYNVNNEILPQGTVYYNQITGDFAYYEKPGLRQMIFKKGLEWESNRYNLPGLLFCFIAEKPFVFAVKTDNLTEDTDLYIAPLMNVSDDGSICMGTGDFVLTNSIRANVALFKKSFWGSAFSHWSGSAGKYETMINPVYSRIKKFPVKELIPSKLKIRNVCK